MALLVWATGHLKAVICNGCPVVAATNDAALRNLAEQGFLSNM